MRTPWALLLLFAVAGCGADGPAAGAPDDAEVVATFSIVARDPDTGDLGIAVQSKFLGVGAVVPWARADVGAVATQAFANPTYGPRGLEMLDVEGASAEDAVNALVTGDRVPGRRQLGIVDARGTAFAFTGDGCLPWAGHVVGNGYCCQGNVLAGEAVVKAMAKSFEETDAPLPERLVAALAAGQAKGGDKRGRQSAALLVVRRGGGYAGMNDRWVDLRVDDHPTPIEELARVLALHRGLFHPERERVPENPEGLVRERTMDEGCARAAWEAWRLRARRGESVPSEVRELVREGQYVGTRRHPGDGRDATIYVWLPGRRGLHQVPMHRAESGVWRPR